MFKTATREQNRLRMALDGPTKAGKTYTALRLAFGLCPEGKIAVLDTEHGKSKLYVGEAPDGIPWHFEICEPSHFAPSTYEQIIRYAGSQGFDVLIIDSLSHAWQGTGGALEQVDKARSGNSFTAWREVTPQHNSMIESILSSPCHVIATLRSKMEYVLEQDERGKMVPKKVGLKPIQREGVEYEFDILGDLDLNHTMVISGTRCSALDGKIFSKPEASLMGMVREWLYTGKAVERSAAPFVPAALATESASGAAVGPTNGVTLATSLRCDEFTAARIIELAQRLEWTPEKLREVIGRAGASRIAELSQEDAFGLVSALQGKFLEKEVDKTF